MAKLCSTFNTANRKFGFKFLVPGKDLIEEPNEDKKENVDARIATMKIENDKRIDRKTASIKNTIQGQ